MKTFVKIVAVLIVVTGLGAGGWFALVKQAKPAITFRTWSGQGRCAQSIAATGTAEPQGDGGRGRAVAGLIDRFGRISVSRVKPWINRSQVNEGDLLAHIDETLYQSDVDSGKAALAQAKANLLGAKAALLQMKAKLVQAEHDWARAQKLGPSDALAQSDYDMYEANYETAKANVAVAEATIAQNERRWRGPTPRSRRRYKTSNIARSLRQ